MCSSLKIRNFQVNGLTCIHGLSGVNVVSSQIKNTNLRYFIKTRPQINLDKTIRWIWEYTQIFIYPIHLNSHLI